MRQMGASVRGVRHLRAAPGHADHGLHQGALIMRQKRAAAVRDRRWAQALTAGAEHGGAPVLQPRPMPTWSAGISRS